MLVTSLECSWAELWDWDIEGCTGVEHTSWGVMWTPATPPAPFLCLAVCWFRGKEKSSVCSSCFSFRSSCQVTLQFLKRHLSSCSFLWIGEGSPHSQFPSCGCPCLPFGDQLGAIFKSPGSRGWALQSTGGNNRPRLNQAPSSLNYKQNAQVIPSDLRVRWEVF